MNSLLINNNIDQVGTFQRRSIIIDTLNRASIVKVSELSDLFKVTKVTIRRDLDALESKGKLKRIHGGALPIESRELSELLKSTSDEKRLIKEKIGFKAAELIDCNENIIIDSGTTPLEVVKNIDENLLQNGDLTIITNSLPVCYELNRIKTINLIILGGLFLPSYEVVVGPQTINHLMDINADKIFVGTDGLTFSQGITTANVLEAEVSRAMIKVAKEVIVVSDSSKIGQKGLAKMGDITEIDKLITDKNASTEFIERLEKHGVEVTLV